MHSSNPSRCSALSHPQGLQRTPGFIHAVVKDACALIASRVKKGNQQGKEKKPLNPPQGGHTDVGLHTGGVRRSTAWPLVRSVVQELMERSMAGLEQQPQATLRSLRQRAMAHFSLWLLERHLAGAEADVEVTQEAVNLGMVAIAAAAAQGAELADEGVETGDLERSLEGARRRLHEAVASRAADVAKEQMLPLVASPGEDASLGGYRSPSLLLPGPAVPAMPGDSLDAARRRAEQNLGWLPLPPAHPLDEVTAEEWARHARLEPGAGELPALLVMRIIERRLFTMAAQELPMPATPGLGSNEKAFHQSAKCMEGIVDRYMKVLDKYRSAPESKALSHAGLRSRELLVVWCACALLHRSAACTHTGSGGPVWWWICQLRFVGEGEVSLRQADNPSPTNRSWHIPVWWLSPSGAYFLTHQSI